MEKLKGKKRQKAEIAGSSVLEVLVYLFLWFIAVVTLGKLVYSSETVRFELGEVSKAKFPVAILYENQEKLVERVGEKILKNTEKYEYCVKKRYGACIAEPLKLKENESLGIVSYRFAVINDDSNFRILKREIGFKNDSESGRWRLFLPDGSIKIADEKATFVSYVPMKYKNFGELFKWLARKYYEKTVNI